MFRRLFVLLMLVGYSLFGTIWHVSTTGNDEGGGRSWATAFGTLEHALAVSRAGDEIWIAAGRYEPAVLWARSLRNRDTYCVPESRYAGASLATKRVPMTASVWIAMAMAL